jgi:hypothetical protein
LLSFNHRQGREGRGLADGRIIKAANSMTRDVATIGPAATVEAAALMVERRVSGLPVVNAARRVVGILTVGSVLHGPGPAPIGTGCVTWRCCCGVRDGSRRDHVRRLRQDPEAQACLRAANVGISLQDAVIV